jgi:hypothetical protein
VNKKQVEGSYYIRVRTTGWYLWFQRYTDGIRKQEKVAVLAYRELGFKVEMSVDEAKARCAQLNKERGLIKTKVRLAAKRVTELKSLNEILFPTSSVEDFQELLKEENFGSNEHLYKLFSHFNFIQEMCNHLKILPIEYAVTFSVW